MFWKVPQVFVLFLMPFYILFHLTANDKVLILANCSFHLYKIEYICLTDNILVKSERN